MSATVEEDIWGGEDDDDFYLSVNLNGEKDVSSNNGGNSKVNTPRPSTSKLSTVIMSESAMGTRLSDIVANSCKKQKQLNGSTPVNVSASNGIKVYRRKNAGYKVAPLRRFKYGRLWVTDITTQFWCELQMVFKYEPPPAMKNVEIIPKAEVVAGCTLHLVRELQIEKRVEVKVTSSEDRFALKVMSLLDGVLSMLMYGKAVRREIHIFGTPFNMGVYVSGIIDEIRCHPETMNFEIVEFKTRMSECMPADAQTVTHKIQVMLYKQLFDEMIDGTFSKQTVAEHNRLDLDKPFGKDLMSQSAHKEANTLSKLLDLLIVTMRGVPFISSLLLEYAFQKDGSTIGYSVVEYDKEWLREKLSHSLSYWKGEREPRGVAIEECWKCIRCDYSDACKWKKALERKHKLKTIKEIRPPEERPPTQEEKVDPWDSSVNSLNSTLSDLNDSNVDINTDVGIVPLAHGEQSSDESVVLFPDEPNNQVVIEPINEVVVEPINEVVIEPINEVVIEPINEVVIEPINEVVIEPIYEIVIE